VAKKERETEGGGLEGKWFSEETLYTIQTLLLQDGAGKTKKNQKRRGTWLARRKGRVSNRRQNPRGAKNLTGNDSH